MTAGAPDAGAALDPEWEPLAFTGRRHSGDSGLRMRQGTPSPAPTLRRDGAWTMAPTRWMLSLWMALGCLGRLWAQELTVREIPELTLSSAPGWTERLEWMASDVSAPSWSVPQDPPDRVTNSLRWVDRSRQRSIGFYRTVVTGWDATTLIQSNPTHEPSGSRRPAGFVWIAPGLFTMGSPAGEPGRGTNEVRRSVLLTRGFWMSDHEVTQSEYRGLMGRNPSGFPGDDRPVENVSWTDAVAYCEALNRKASGLGELPPGHAYRLPTEAEWEYAARAGSGTSYPWGESEAEIGRHAWHAGTAEFSTREVRRLSPNRWGLHDLLGNVWEWCLDWGAVPSDTASLEPVGPRIGSLRVIRGGSYLDDPRWLRTAARMAFRPDWSGDCLGFRPVLAATDPPGSGRLGLRMVPELTLRGRPGTRYRIERTRSPQVTNSWESAAQLDLGTNSLIVWTDLSERPPGWSYRAVQIVENGGEGGGGSGGPGGVGDGGGPLRPGEPTNGRTAGFVWVSGGTFRMGSPDTELGRRFNEVTRTVTLTRGYWMSDHEVTEAEFESQLGRASTPAHGPRFPVQATWVDAVRYCQALTDKARAGGTLPEGFVYRLPTEAEWENACRAGTTTRYSWGDDPDGLDIGKHAWSWVASHHEVRQLLPNPLGLYDMSGNLWEWCADSYRDTFPDTAVDPLATGSITRRSIRGGGYYEFFSRSRSAARGGAQTPDWRDLGFRPVLARPL